MFVLGEKNCPNYLNLCLQVKQFFKGAVQKRCLLYSFLVTIEVLIRYRSFKMTARVWATSEDGSFEFASLTSDRLEDAISVLDGSFFLHEKVCIGVELSQHPEAVAALEELHKRIAMEGVSLVAIEKATGKTVGVAFNKLLVKTVNSANYCEEFIAGWTSPSAKAFLQFMLDVDAAADLFNLCKANCVFEIASLAVLPDYRCKGIGRQLFELSTDLAKALLFSKNVKVPLDNNNALPTTPVPTVISVTCTTTITQNFAKQLGFLQAAGVSYETSVFEGRSLASRIGSDDTLGAAVEYKILQ